MSPDNYPSGFEIINEGEDIILRVECEGKSYPPSLEDSEKAMSEIITYLAENKGVTKIILNQKRDYEYNSLQTGMLDEIARLYSELTKQKNTYSYKALVFDQACAARAMTWFTLLQNIVKNLLRSDPIGAYVELLRIIREETIELNNETQNPIIQDCMRRFISLIKKLQSRLESTQLLRLAKPYVSGYRMGDRSVYRKLFQPTIKPDFMFTKLMAMYPSDGEELDNYVLSDDTEVTIFKLPDSVQTLYHIMPPEFKLEEEKYELLDMARRIMAEHKPKKSDFVDPARMRQIFYNVGSDLLEELADQKGIKLRRRELNKLTKILIRYTVGFGLIEVLLQDEQIQDISINSPLGKTPIFIVHGKYDDCKTNIIPTAIESESWASKLRMISGRPLDEANPILDTELELPGASTRVSVISEPLDPSGIAFSFRRHRDRPWTLPLFIKNRMINDVGAGLMGFLIDGTRSMLIAGTRSSGKSSFLSSLLVEIMRRYRIITIEDTLELPTKPLRKLGFNIQSMKVASALSQGSSEMSAADGIRATLRLGDSSLIIGEVRSAEAVALYEAMRVGAAANVVAGTIHGDSPYGVYDRVVNDIGVPKTSFKATDIIVTVNPIKSADGLHKYRRVLQITEVGKKWENDPLLEGAFIDLMKYDVKTDTLQSTDALNNGESEILKTIAGNVKEFAGNWDAVWDNIMLRSRIKRAQVDMAEKTGNDDLLESAFTIECNDRFHQISESVRDELGTMDPERIEREWKNWLSSRVKRIQQGGFSDES